MRFNWGAFCLPVLWGVAHSVWPFVALWLGVSLLPLLASAFGLLMDGNGTVSVPALVGVTVVSDALLGFVRIWAGGNANKLYWERETRRLSADPAAEPKSDIGLYSARQRTWMLWGVAALGAGMAMTVAANYVQLKPYGLQWAFIGEAAVFLVAEVALGLWFAQQMRSEYPETVVPSIADAEPASDDDTPDPGEG